MPALVCGGCGGRLSPLRTEEWDQAAVRVCITDRIPWIVDGQDFRIFKERPGETAPPARSAEARGPGRLEVACRCGRRHLIRTDKVAAAFLRVREAGGRNVVVGEGRHQRRTGSFHI